MVVEDDDVRGVGDGEDDNDDDDEYLPLLGDLLLPRLGDKDRPREFSRRLRPRPRLLLSFTFSSSFSSYIVVFCDMIVVKGKNNEK